MELPNIRSHFHSLLDKRLNVEAAAAILQVWSDKVQGNPIRRWESLPESAQEMYRLLTYQVLCAAVSDEEDASDIAYYADISIGRAEAAVLAP